MILSTKMVMSPLFLRGSFLFACMSGTLKEATLSRVYLIRSNTEGSSLVVLTRRLAS